jgi:hypothetical protein
VVSLKLDATPTRAAAAVRYGSNPVPRTWRLRPGSSLNPIGSVATGPLVSQMAPDDATVGSGPGRHLDLDPNQASGRAVLPHAACGGAVVSGYAHGHCDHVSGNAGEHQRCRKLFRPSLPERASTRLYRLRQPCRASEPKPTRCFSSRWLSRGTIGDSMWLRLTPIRPDSYSPPHRRRATRPPILCWLLHFAY